MSDHTPRLALPYLHVAQAQKEVTQMRRCNVSISVFNVSSKTCAMRRLRLLQKARVGLCLRLRSRNGPIMLAQLPNGHLGGGALSTPLKDFKYGSAQPALFCAIMGRIGRQISLQQACESAVSRLSGHAAPEFQSLLAARWSTQSVAPAWLN